MNIDTIMSKDIIVASIHDHVETVATLMKKYDIGFIPLVLNKKIMGVITDRDLVVGMLANHLDIDQSVEHYMTKNIISINVHKSIADAINLMGKNKIKRLIVTNRKKVVGVLSISDLINTNVNPDIIMKNLKQINEIYRNIDRFDTEIDEFYL